MSIKGMNKILIYITQYADLTGFLTVSFRVRMLFLVVPPEPYAQFIPASGVHLNPIEILITKDQLSTFQQEINIKKKRINNINFFQDETRYGVWGAGSKNRGTPWLKKCCVVFRLCGSKGLNNFA